jgi:DNA helicase-2/ATP-dependent DNA helicase PcrA
MRCAIDKRVSTWEVMTNLDKYDAGISGAIAKKLTGFCDLISEFRTMVDDGVDAFTITGQIIRRTELLSSLMTDRTPESISKQENIQELLSGVQEFVNDKVEQDSEGGVTLVDFLNEVSLATDQDSTDASEAAVTLMTVHAAKGLEFSNVFIVGVEEDLFPSAMSNSSMSEIEEERRLLYVAITRAKTNCTISYASSRYRNGETKSCSPSRFLKDIDSRYLHIATNNDFARREGIINPIDNYRSSMPQSRQSSFNHPLINRTTPTVTAQPSQSNDGEDAYHAASELTVGMSIEHSRFGIGEIVDIDTSGTDDRIEVNFKNLGTKKLLLKFARFKIIE